MSFNNFSELNGLVRTRVYEAEFEAGRKRGSKEGIDGVWIERAIESGQPNEKQINSAWTFREFVYVHSTQHNTNSAGYLQHAPSAELSKLT